MVSSRGVGSSQLPHLSAALRCHPVSSGMSQWPPAQHLNEPSDSFSTQHHTEPALKHISGVTSTWPQSTPCQPFMAARVKSKLQCGFTASPLMFPASFGSTAPLLSVPQPHGLPVCPVLSQASSPPGIFMQAVISCLDPLYSYPLPVPARMRLTSIR